MAEYIEREAFLKVLRGRAVAKYPASFAIGLFAAADELQKMPAAYVAPISDAYFSKSSLLSDLDWLESVGCKRIEIQALRERLEYGAVKPACDIARVVYRQNEKEK